MSQQEVRSAKHNCVPGTMTGGKERTAGQPVNAFKSLWLALR